MCWRLTLARGADGRLILASLAAPAPLAPPVAASAPASAPATGEAWQLTMDQLELADARVRWNDASTRPAAALQLDGIAVRGREWRWPLQGTVPVTIAATLRGQADAAPAAGTLAIDGRFGLHEAQAGLQLSGLSLAALSPYVAQALVPQLDGAVSLQGRLE